MSKELTKKGVDLLLKGATLVADPCPYCKGVRIMKDGSALCVSCGRESKEEKAESELSNSEHKGESTTLDNLDAKIKSLTEELKKENDFEKQKQILGSINEIISIKEKIRSL